MVKKEQEKTQTTQEEKKTYDVAELFTGKHLDDIIENETNRRDTTAARDELKAELITYENMQKEMQVLQTAVMKYTDKVQTGYDWDKATFLQKTAVRFTPGPWKENVKKNIAKKHQDSYIDNLYEAIKNLNAATYANDGKIKTVASKHGELRRLVDTKYNKIQEEAIKTMDEQLDKVNDYTADFKAQEATVKTLVEDETKKQEYIDAKKKLGQIEDALFLAKQDLVKATIRYEVAEDHYYEGIELIENMKRTMEIMDTYNYKVQYKTQLSEELMQYKISTDKLLDAGTELMQLDDAMTKALQAGAVSRSKRIKLLGEITMSELERKTYEPIIPLQKKLNEETKKIIAETHANYVAKVQSGEYAKRMQTLDEQIKNGEDVQTDYQNEA